MMYMTSLACIIAEHLYVSLGNDFKRGGLGLSSKRFTQSEININNYVQKWFSQ